MTVEMIFSPGWRSFVTLDMDAYHVAAWSKGGLTELKNCQMLCKTYNRAKGNR
jgi:hypothetical protein